METKPREINRGYGLLCLKSTVRKEQVTGLWVSLRERYSQATTTTELPHGNNQPLESMSLPETLVGPHLCALGKFFYLAVCSRQHLCNSTSLYPHWLNSHYGTPVLEKVSTSHRPLSLWRPHRQCPTGAPECGSTENDIGFCLSGLLDRLQMPFRAPQPPTSQPPPHPSLTAL